MPAARYWRVVGVAAVGGSDLELSTLHLYAATGRVDASATLSSSHTPASGALADLQDASDTTVCAFSGGALRANGFWIGWDFGGDPQDVKSLRVGSGSSRAKYLAQCLLQYFDGSGWATLRTVLPATYPGPLALGGLTGDPDFAYSVLRLHADVPLGSTTAPDTSQYGSTASASGSASIQSVGAPFGNAFYGSAWSVPSSSRFDLGTQDYKLECVIRSFGSAAGNQGLVVRDLIGGTRGWLMFLGDGTGGTTFGALAFGEWNGPSNLGIQSTFVPPVGVNTHVAVTRESGVYKLWANGSVVGVNSDNLSFVSPASSLPITIGALSFTGGYNSPFNGTIDEVDLTVGRAVFTAPFTPRTVPLDDFEGGASTQPLDISAQQTAVTSPYAWYGIPGSVQALSTARQSAFRDTEFGGAGRVWGTTKIKALPSNLPTRARVLLLHQRSKVVAREMWSDPVTGTFSFEGIDTRQEFITLAEDAAGAYLPVAANKLVPEVLP